MTPRLLFLPGAGGDPGFWRPLGDLLPAEWEKTYFAWPGLGDQEARPAVNSFDDLVRIVAGALGDSPVDLFAQSMGGLVGARIAITCPGRVRRLVLAATTAGGVNASDYGAHDWRPDYQRDHPRAAKWISDPGLVYPNDLRCVTQPTLLLWGGADPICPVAVGEALAGLIPAARLVVVPGGDHGFVRDRPGEIIDAVRLHIG